MKWLYSLAPGDVELARTSNNRSAYDVCLRSGFLEGIVFLESINLPFDPLASLSAVPLIAEAGHMNILQWLLDHNVSLEDQPESCPLTIAAIIGGQLDTLKWLLNHGCALKPQHGNPPSLLPSDTTTSTSQSS